MHTHKYIKFLSPSSFSEDTSNREFDTVVSQNKTAVASFRFSCCVLGKAQ